MLIWLLRHGMTALGQQKRYQGRTDTSLSETGRLCLRPAALRPGKVYVSPMLRARETAEILFPEARQLCVPDLREMDFGAFEGRGWWEMETDPAYRRWVEGECRGRCPGGEDRAGFSDRVCRAFAALVDTARTQGEEQLIVVAHGGTQMAVLERWGRPARPYYAGQTACGCGWQLEDSAWPETLKIEKELCFTR